ncbi:IucA/IucC family protein [Streptomyces xiamenensis]
MHPQDPHQAVAHLTPELWEQAGRRLIRKALAEFSHERLLTPTEDPEHPGHFTVPTDDGTVTYRFTARRRALDHWQIDADSITRHHRDGSELPLSALDFFIELRTALKLSDAILPVYLEEISSTLAGAAHKLAGELSTDPATRRPSAAELARADFQTVEAGMTEGHPCFVANNGRLGFDAAEYHAYAPETGAPVQLIWLAARRDLTTFSASAGLDYEDLIAAELSPADRDAFAAHLTGQGLEPADYRLIPVHPWQWWNRISVTFAAEVAQRHLVYLGPGEDSYRAQQSIRTFFNTDAPGKHYVKTALSVLNMGFLRGLSAAYMEVTPAINDWLHELVSADPRLRALGFGILRERAAIGYHHPQYESVAAKGSPYLKMLAALWRESPVPSLEPGQRLATMASLLHVDARGDALAATLIKDSGLAPEEWLRRYLDAYLAPLLHCFYRYGLVYMPHGENVILVLRDGVPERAIMKDIAEEIAVFDPATPIPAGIERIRVDIPEEERPLSLFTDVFDCFLRFLNSTLAEAGVLTEDAFWGTVAGCVSDYQELHPELADRFKRYDLFTETFALSCLNRLQLRNNQQMVDLTDPSAALQFIGTLDNPIAKFA